MTTLTAKNASIAWLRLPFSAGPWRNTAYILLALPAALTAVVDGGRLQQRLAEVLLKHETRMTRTRALLGLPLIMVAWPVTGYGWFIVALNLAYPLRPLLGIPGYDPHAWGGPTYAGVWAFHAFFGGLPFLFVMPLVLRGLTALHVRVLGRCNG